MNSNVEIINKTSHKLAMFRALSYGDFFVKGDVLYRKTKPTPFQGKCLSMRMLDGEYVDIYDEDLVKIVNVKIAYEDL